MLFHVIATFGFFLAAASVQKDLQKLQTTAINAFYTKDYIKAKTAYEELVGCMSLKTVGWTTFVDTNVRLCEILLALNEYEEGQKRLDALVRLNPPIQFQDVIDTLASRFLASCGDTQNAYVRLKKVSHTFPLEHWKTEDRLFFHTLEICLDDRFCALKKRAKRFAKASDFKNASLMYEQILQAIEGDYFPKAANAPLLEKQIRYLLAESQFSQERWEQKLSFQSEEQCDLQKQLRLATHCYKTQMHYLKAVDCIPQADIEEDELFDCLFEIGYGYYQAKQNSRAQHYFEKAILGNSRCSLLARIYLSHIFLEEKKTKEVETLLSCCSHFLEKEDLLSFEIAFLLASAACEEKDYLRASNLFEKALQFKCSQKLLCEKALLKLGYCYMQLGSSFSLSFAEGQTFLKKAQTHFENLLPLSTNENIPLNLARVYLLQGEKNKVVPLLMQRFSLYPLDAKIEAWLLMSQVEKSYVEKKNLLCRATESSMENTALFFESWCLRGLCELKEGNYKEAIAAFEKTPFLSPSLHLQDLLAQAFQALDSGTDERCYLRALVASKTPFLRQQAIDSFHALISQYNASPYNSLAKVTLARLYFDQKNYVEAYPLFKALNTHPEALFWAGKTSEMLGEKEESKAFYRAYVENYPTGPLAAVAYFHQYSEEEYQKGTKEALACLSLFPSLFPKDPLCAVAFYFLAIHETDDIKKSALCEKGLLVPLNQEALSQLFRSQLFRKKMQVLLADLYLKKQEPQKALTALAFFSKTQSLNPLLEQECQWREALAYLKLKDTKRAQECLLTLVASSIEAGCFESPLLRQAWQELGHLADSYKSPEIAVDCFEMAQSCLSQNISLGGH